MFLFLLYQFIKLPQKNWHYKYSLSEKDERHLVSMLTQNVSSRYHFIRLIQTSQIVILPLENPSAQNEANNHLIT